MITSTGPIVASAGVPPPPPPFKWPVDTDLVLTENLKKIMLTSQRPLIRVIIAESIENVHACLQFENVFPDFTLAITFVKRSLIAAAKAHQPGADLIRQRITHDKDYFLKIMPLVRFSRSPTTSLILLHSHGPESASFGARSRNAAMLFAYQP